MNDHLRGQVQNSDTTYSHLAPAARENSKDHPELPEIPLVVLNDLYRVADSEGRH